MMNDKTRLNAVLRNDLTSFIIKTFQTVDGSQPFIYGSHIDLLAHWLEKCRFGETRRLIINLPPRSLKSICASVAFPAWILGHDPSARLVCASYSSDLALKHARDCRHVIETAWYKEVFSQTRLNKRKNTEEEFETTGRGYRLSTSVGGTLTGRGGNFLIIDDPIKPHDALSAKKRKAVNEWFQGTLYSRLDDKEKGVIIVIMQRVHIDDLVAQLIEKGDWELLNLPAIAEREEMWDLGGGRVFSREPGDPLHPEREPLEVLKKVQENIGTFFYSAQYQQRPIPEGGNMIKWDWFRTFDKIPASETAMDITAQSWDTAMKAYDGTDWSVCTTWKVRGSQYYLIDVFRARLDFPSLKKKVIDLQREFAADVVLIEDKGSGTGLIQQLQSERVLFPIAVNPEGAKEDRMAAQSAKIEAGQVMIPERATWVDDFQAEILSFPHGKHDDQVDSLSQFLKWVAERWRNRVTFSRTTGHY